MIKFYMTPGSCSTGIHILLEELELIFEAHLVDLLRGDNQTEQYLAINAKGTIPTLLIDNNIALTSFESIAFWLAQNHPQHKLLPDSSILQARALELTSYCVHVIHGQGFSRIFTGEKYLVNEASLTEQQRQQQLQHIKQQGNSIVNQGFSWISRQFQSTYLLEHFSMSDAALFYVEFWAQRSDIQLPKTCADHYLAMIKRPAVRQVLGEEGYRI